MIPKKAIEKAMEGGWHAGCNVHYFKNSVEIAVRSPNGWNEITYRHEQIILDPSFWQALEKSLKEKHLWRMWAHDFYDLILTGADTEKFWNELLTV
jgi:hypothetical protein